jgi:ketosteroid isomerase-like protein
MRLGLGGVCNDSAVKRAVVDAFYKAYAERDVVAVAAFIGDDVEWTISGPIEALKFCGTYHGKAGLWELTMEFHGPKLRCSR